MAIPVPTSPYIGNSRVKKQVIKSQKHSYSN
jgi:hypothetical protein